jgi:hypothetical protein
MSGDQLGLPGMTRTEQPTPEELRDDAIARVRKGAGDWCDRALAVVRVVCRDREEFTTDAVHWYGLAIGLEDPPEPRAWGAVMKAAIGELCVKTTQPNVKSQRRECHARPIPIYRSLIYRSGR